MTLSAEGIGISQTGNVNSGGYSLYPVYDAIDNLWKLWGNWILIGFSIINMSWVSKF